MTTRPNTAYVAGCLREMLRDTDSRYSDLITKQSTVVEEMRIRGDLQNIGRQMNNVLLVKEPPAGLDALDRSIADLFVGIERSLGVIKKESQGHLDDVGQEIVAALPHIRATIVSTIAVKRTAGGDHDADARAAWGGQDGRPLVVATYDRIAKAADVSLQQVNDTSMPIPTARTALHY